MAWYDDNSTFSKVGGALGKFAPIVGFGLSLAGGLLDNSSEEEMKLKKKQLELQEQSQAEQAREFGLNFGQHKYEADKNFSLSGLGELANIRNEAAKNGRQYRFNNALYASLSGQGA